VFIFLHTRSGLLKSSAKARRMTLFKEKAKMLVLSRDVDQDVIIFVDYAKLKPGITEIVVKIVDVRGSKVRLGFEGPKEVVIHRREVAEAIGRDGQRMS